MLDLTKILGDHIVGLRVRRVAVALRPRVRHRRGACGGGLLPRALVERQHTEDVVVAHQRGTGCVVVSERAQVWERFSCLRREPCSPFQLFVFVDSLHREKLLARGLPATVVATEHRAACFQRDSVPPTLVCVCSPSSQTARGDGVYPLERGCPVMEGSLIAV